MRLDLKIMRFDIFDRHPTIIYIHPVGFQQNSMKTINQRVRKKTNPGKSSSNHHEVPLKNLNIPLKSSKSRHLKNRTPDAASRFAHDDREMLAVTSEEGDVGW